MNLSFYSVASSAARGAKRAGVSEAIIFQTNDGKFTFLDMHNLPTDLELFAICRQSNFRDVAPDTMAAADERAKPAPVVAKPAPVAPSAGLPKPGEVVIPVSTRSSYKELARRSPPKSTIENPVDIVWAFVAENPDMPRKQAITALVNLGINLATVKTQYQKAKSGKARFKAKETK